MSVVVLRERAEAFKLVVDSDMNTSVENYFTQGCGRCPLGGTPDCKVHRWVAELQYLREIVLDCGLNEESKWDVPCYTFQSSNILIISAFKEYCSLSFFKGSLIQDDKKLLDKPGPNSQAARLFKFTSLDQIKRVESDIEAYIFEALEIEKADLKVEFKKESEPIPDELKAKFDEDPNFKMAFEALTQGRQRGYILHISQAKQSATRISRIQKCEPLILSGIGLNDKYGRRD